ncbi:MAG: threonine/serine dehydratase [Hyphomonadaceae bacterium]|nr:threonine/serine dehydratase [Hyphomonadaceae bacterium]
MADLALPTAADIKAAAERIKPLAVRTPLLRNAVLDERAGARILIKPECLQTTGSFKIRGASNRLGQLTDTERRAGVVAFSSGNHAQGVARAAQYFGMPAVIVMPSDAPKVKLDGVRRDGAEIVLYERNRESREQIAEALVRERGAVLVPSFDDPYIVTGQGTVGLEIAAQARELGRSVDHLLCCTGGGGLITGSALALHDTFPQARVWTVEPQGHDDWKRSLDSGRIETNAPGTRSICDAILTPAPGQMPFALSNHLAGGQVVSDEEVRAAVRFAFTHLKLVVEPGGAVALAAALRGLPDEMRGRDVAIILSGGNVDPGIYAEILHGADQS